MKIVTKCVGKSVILKELGLYWHLLWLTMDSGFNTLIEEHCSLNASFLISAHTLSHVLTAHQQTIASISLSLCHQIGLKDIVIFNGENNESSSSGARLGRQWEQWCCDLIDLQRCETRPTLKTTMSHWWLIWCWIWLG